MTDEKKPPTQSQQELASRVFRFVRDYTEANCFPPSQREIAEQIGSNVSQVNHALRLLVEQGIIEVHDTHGRGAPRSIRVVGAKMVMPEVHL